MRRIRFVGLRFIAFGAAWLAVMGLLTFELWNNLIPVIFGLSALTYWQALGLFLLCRILFGGVGGWGRRMRHARFARGWKSLTPEERERFREAMGKHCPARFQEASEPRA